MKTSCALWRLTAVAVVLATLVITLPAYADVPPDPNFPPVPVPIPMQPDGRPVPAFIGQPAVPQPVSAQAIPQNPSMAAGAWSVVHNDTYMSDTYPQGGPLGNNWDVESVLLASIADPNDPRPCLPGTAVFDQHGRLLAAVQKPEPYSAYMRAWLTLFDPETLKPLAWLALPLEERPPQDGRIMKLPAGAYFYLDAQDRAVIGTAARTIWVVSHDCSGQTCTLNKELEYDLTGIIPPDDDFQAVQPDWSGRLWFASKGGLVGTFDLDHGNLLGYTKLPADEIIENAIAADETGGIYLDSSKALYRFDFDPDADEDGEPAITWREPYDGGTHVKVLSRGSGTTPTLMGFDYVAIVDNADPQAHVLVYRRAKTVEGPRLVCAEPVFMPGQSNSENSLIATEKSIVVENNFGYRGIKSTLHGSTSKPGIARIDLDEDGNGCHTVWTNWEESVASAATQKMSLGNGLIYTYTKSKGPVTTDAYYFTAVDFRTGETVYKVLAGTGMLYNDHLSVLYVGPNERIYVGVMGGIVSLRDVR